MDDAITKAFVLKATRLVHRYSGIFFAPTILFFAITGGLRMFGLHETSRGQFLSSSGHSCPSFTIAQKKDVYLPPRKEKPARKNLGTGETYPMRKPMRKLAGQAIDAAVVLMALTA
jgi:hypothetical protein